MRIEESNQMLFGWSIEIGSFEYVLKARLRAEENPMGRIGPWPARLTEIAQVIEDRHGKAVLERIEEKTGEKIT